jgi:hypothetical protein
MAITTTLIVAFVLYLAFMVAVMYICIFADPETSPTARFWTEKVPSIVTKFLRRVLGSKSLSVLEFFADRVLSLLYLVIVCGSWSIIVTYVYPWVDRQSYVPSYHKIIGYVVFAASLSSWRLASTTSPGIITAKTLDRYNHFPYDELGSKQVRPFQVRQQYSAFRPLLRMGEQYRWRGELPVLSALSIRPIRQVRIWSKYDISFVSR